MGGGIDMLSAPLVEQNATGYHSGGCLIVAPLRISP
jgi:hypothetical protein